MKDEHELLDELLKIKCSEKIRAVIRILEFTQQILKSQLQDIENKIKELKEMIK